MNTSIIRNILTKDAISAGYGVAAGSIRKLANKVLGDRGIGQAGMNAISLVAGMGLSQLENPHAKVIGSALRISSIASVGNALVEKVIGNKKDDKDQQ